MADSFVDITPTPRTLRMLGEIPFSPWQCFAELIDNSVDAFLANDADRDDRRIQIIWSPERVGLKERTIEIIDNACGMTLEQMTNAVKAGYSGNDPINNLGLFGMGYNIATARLGDKSTIFTTRAGDDKWVGVEIDFSQLISQKSFKTPVVYKEKDDISEHGTKIIISKLNNGIYNDISTKTAAIRRQLENVYSLLLEKHNIEIYVQGRRLVPKKYCVWSPERYVIRDGQRVYAVQKIDRVLGETYFDMERNRYLSPEQEDEIEIAVSRGEPLPPNIVKRQKRLKGWVGIQRYFSTNDYGIDFVRNGRKILIANKDAFYFEDGATGSSTIQYPVELGSTVGGRIVGVVEVDYLLPTYQKNDFVRTDLSWIQTMEAIRGQGPILPTARKAYGYADKNESPVGILATAYRRPDKGSKNLVLPKDVAKAFADRFYKGDADYISDEKWYQAVREADREIGTFGAGDAGDVDVGDAPSDDVSSYFGEEGADVEPQAAPEEEHHKAVPSQTASSTCDELLRGSEENALLSRQYAYNPYPLNVRAHKMKTEIIRYNGKRVPAAFFSDGIECDFFYDPRHELLAQFPSCNPESLLMIYLANKFAARDSVGDIVSIYSALTVSELKDMRVDKSSLNEQATMFFDEFKERLGAALAHKYEEVIACLKESVGEEEATITALLTEPDLLTAYNEGTAESIGIIQYVPLNTLIRLVDRFPDDVFDGKVFRAKYNTLPNTGNADSMERIKAESKERIISMLKDALLVQGEKSARLSKNEMTKCAWSIATLKGELI